MALLGTPFTHSVILLRRLVPSPDRKIYTEHRINFQPLVCSKLGYLCSSSMNNNTTNQAGLNCVASNTSDSSDPNPTKTVRVMIKGRVQGVFYRNWTVENARGLGLKGWVRNRRDGSVEALFSGYPDAVHEMEQRCRRGPPQAAVTGFQVFPSDDDPGPGFDKKPTV